MPKTDDFRNIGYTHHQGNVLEVPSVGREIKSFVDKEKIEDYVFIQTCNRSEVYFFSSSFKDNIPKKTAGRNGEEALKHLLEVVSGVNSLIVGESEILNQVREAYKKSIEEGRASAKLKGVFDWALKFGKKVRRETCISSGKISVASIGLEYAEDILRGFEGKRAAVIGAGKMGTIAARYLNGAGIQEIVVANRTYENAVKLSEEIGGESYRLSKLPDLLEEVEIVVCATSAPHYILTREKIPDLDDKIVLLDLSVPTNVHPEVKKNEKIEYISYKELSGKARENLINRRGEVKKVQKMIEKETKNFLQGDQFEDLYKKVEKIRKKQVEKAKEELAKRDIDSVLRDFSRSLSEKILSALKEEIKTEPR